MVNLNDLIKLAIERQGDIYKDGCLTRGLTRLECEAWNDQEALGVCRQLELTGHNRCQQAELAELIMIIYK